jgi:hypothetical protein
MPKDPEVLPSLGRAECPLVIRHGTGDIMVLVQAVQIRAEKYVQFS